MNRSELAALISSTMPQPHSSSAVRACQPSPYPQSHLPVRNPPRQQSSTSRLRHGHTRHTKSEADAAPTQAPAPATPRAQHETGSQPQHARSYSYLPQVKTPQIHHGKKGRKSMAADIEEPDFVKEEREAWSRKSPKDEAEFEPRTKPSSYGRATRSSYPNPEIVLEPPRQSREPPPQPRKQTKQTLPLREFGPAAQDTDIDDRPKTSRGPSSQGQDETQSRRLEDSGDKATTKQAPRRSKFLEGSLTERSHAVASSWYEHDSASEDSSDSDANLRSSRDTRESASFESTERKTLPPTPATTKKKKLFKLKSSIKSSEDSESVEVQAMPKKRGLRKSLSTWNFHNLGDKMRIFGGSTNDLTPKAAKPEKGKQSFVQTPAKDILDERKRKAGEAYAQQFGLKKQKSNSGIANSAHPSQVSVNTKPSSLKRRTASSSSRTPSSSYRNRISSATSAYSFASDNISSDLDNSKRPSREELEKENQQLRNMLRQSSSSQFDPHRSSVHLPLSEAPDQTNIPRLSQENFAQGNKMRLSPGKNMGRRGEDVPPVPKLSREVLGSLENCWSTRGRVDGKGMLPRPVSMILEEEESKDVGEMVDNATSVRMEMSPIKEQWDWPEDVF